MIVEEKTVSTGPSEMECHGGMRDPEGAGDLSETGTGDGETSDGQEQLGSVKPVGGSEGARGEPSSTMETAESLLRVR